MTVERLFNLDGKIAVVTGGGSGFGRSFCQVLADAGADIVCVDVNAARAEETCSIVKSSGRRTLPLAVDVSDYNQVSMMLKTIEEKLGPPDIFINNAGVTTKTMPLDQIDIQEWHRVINIDLHGVFYCMKETLSSFLRNKKKGVIINIASILGISPSDPKINSLSPYGAAKSAVIWVTKQSAVDYGQFGIRINCIAPGWFKGTKLAEDAGIKRTKEEFENWEKAVIDRTPLGRRGEIDDLNALVLYLSTDASSFVTGQVISVDGGWICL